MIQFNLTQNQINKKILELTSELDTAAFKLDTLEILPNLFADLAENLPKGKNKEDILAGVDFMEAQIKDLNKSTAKTFLKLLNIIESLKNLQKLQKQMQQAKQAKKIKKEKKKHRGKNGKK